MPEKVLALVSGGPDSATMAYSAKNNGADLSLLHLYQGKPHSDKELECARKLALALDSRLDVIDVSSIVQIMGSVLTIHSEAAVLPYGTGIVLSIASAYALKIKASKVYLAIHADDTAEGPEFSDEFLNAMSRTVHTSGASADLTIEAPLLTMHKPDIIRMGQTLDVPFEDTWSCIGVESHHCGLCGACHARQRAFQLAGIPDPTVYVHQSSSSSAG